MDWASTVALIALVDRLEGGRQALEDEGFAVETLFTRRDFMADSEVLNEPDEKSSSRIAESKA